MHARNRLFCGPQLLATLVGMGACGSGSSSPTVSEPPVSEPPVDDTPISGLDPDLFVSGALISSANTESCVLRRDDGHAAVMGYAMDGYAIHGMLNADGMEPTDLDNCLALALCTAARVSW